MSKFDEITDKDLKEECQQRGLVTDDHQEVVDERNLLEMSLTDSYEDAERQVNDNDADWSRRLQVLCDSYQYDCERVHAGKMKDFLVDHGGLIA